MGTDQISQSDSGTPPADTPLEAGHQALILEVITPALRAQSEDDILQFYQLRSEVFVDELEWDLPLARDGYEIDEFDGPRTTYILVKTGEGRVVAGMRLLPTDGSHLLQEHFSFLVSENMEYGARVVESSRSCVAPDVRGTKIAKPIYGMLIVGVIGHCLETNISSICFVSDDAFLQKLSQKLEVRRLGPVVAYKKQMLAAGVVEMSDRALEMMEAAVGSHMSAMVRVPAERHSVPA